MIYLIFVFFIFFIILLIPIDIVINAKNEVQIKVLWCFGIIKYVPSKKQFKAKKTIKKNITKKKKSKSSIFGLLTNEKFLWRVFDYLLSMLKSVHIKSGKINIEFGLDDPADTAILLGKIYAHQYSWLDPSEKRLKIHPNFNQACFKAEGAILIRLYPVELIYKTTLFLVSPILWRGLYVARYAKA